MLEVYVHRSNEQQWRQIERENFRCSWLNLLQLCLLRRECCWINECECVGFMEWWMEFHHVKIVTVYTTRFLELRFQDGEPRSIRVDFQERGFLHIFSKNSDFLFFRFQIFPVLFFGLKFKKQKHKNRVCVAKLHEF